MIFSLYTSKAPCTEGISELAHIPHRLLAYSVSRNTFILVKKAVIFPIWKQEDIYDPSNYRSSLILNLLFSSQTKYLCLLCEPIMPPLLTRSILASVHCQILSLLVFNLLAHIFLKHCQPVNFDSLNVHIHVSLPAGVFSSVDICCVSEMRIQDSGSAVQLIAPNTSSRYSLCNPEDQAD